MWRTHDIGDLSRERAGRLHRRAVRSEAGAPFVPGWPRMTTPPNPITRRERRLKISQPVRVRAEDFAESVQLGETRDLARSGVYAICPDNPFHMGMHVHLILGYCGGDPVQDEWLAEVLRIERREDGKWGIAMRILMR